MTSMLELGMFTLKTEDTILEDCTAKQMLATIEKEDKQIHYTDDGKIVLLACLN